jgi:hypothetical protein
VSRSLFDAAQRRLALRPKRRTRESLLAIAREIHDAHGRLTARLINETPGAPSASAFEQRFGSILDLCNELGHPNGKARRRSPLHLEPDEALRRLAELHRTAGYLTVRLINAAPNLPNAKYYAGRFGSVGAVYAMVGFVPLTRTQVLSPVGRARLAAGAVRAERWWTGVADAGQSAAGTLETPRA